MGSQRSQNNYEILRCWVPVTALKMVQNMNFIRFIIFSLVINVHSQHDQHRALVSHDNFHGTVIDQKGAFGGVNGNYENKQAVLQYLDIFSLFSKTETNEKDGKIITMTSKLKELLQRVAMEEKLRKDMERLVILQS